MLSYTFVDAFTRSPRHEAIDRLKRAIAEADGVIVDFAFYNEAIRLSVELEAGALPRLCDALEAFEVHLFDKCAADLGRETVPETASNLVVAMLHVAFAGEVELAQAYSAA